MNLQTQFNDLVFNPITIILFIVFTKFIIFFYKYKQYRKSTYYHITNNSYLSVCFNKGLLGEYLLYKRLRSFENTGGKFLFNLYIPSGNKTTERYLSEDEEKELMKYAPDAIKPIITTGLHTGLRKQNILSLMWDNINFEFGYIEILENKGNKHIKIPMTETLKTLFKEMKRESEYIFINPQTKKPYKDFRRLWNKAKADAGIENLRFHDLRHTVATRLAKNNIPIPTIKGILAHSDVSTTMRYVHAVSSDEIKAMNVLDSYN